MARNKASNDGLFASTQRDLYDLITGDENARVCRDIPESACQHVPRNFFIHLIALVATKSGDLLASPKLVLPWLLGGLGAPSFITGMLVPVREAMALLPQLIVASYLRRAPVRKYYWVAGSLVQGLCVLAMAGVGLAGLNGAAAGWCVLALLLLFSLGRGICSVAAKDVIGKTVSKNRRGMVSGYAASVAGISAIGLGLFFVFAGKPGTGSVIAMLIAAACLWAFAAVVFARLREQPGATSGGGNAAAEAVRSWRYLRHDAALRNFIIARSLLISTALAAPFYVLLAQQGGAGAVGFGLLLLASGAANTLSAGVWGRLADRSSRKVMLAAGGLGAASGCAIVGVDLLALSTPLQPLGYAFAYLMLGVAHSGVRLGRKTYLVDLATQDNRATYVALSNSLVGIILLLAGGLVSLLSLFVGNAATVVVLAVTALVGGLYTLKLPEVEAA